MRHWSQLVTKNWLARPIRSAGAVAALAIGTALVVWVTASFESIRLAVTEWAAGYVGNSHVNVQSPLGKYGTISDRLIEPLSEIEAVAHAAPMLVRRIQGQFVPEDGGASVTVGGRRLTVPLDAYGIDRDRDQHVRAWRILPGNGRLFTPDEEWVAVVERSIAEQAGVEVGGTLRLWGSSRTEPFELEIVGLMERRRAGRLQKGLVLLPLETLQAIEGQQGRLTSVDLVLADPSPEQTRQVRALAAGVVKRTPFAGAAHVRDASDRMRQIEHAQQQQGTILGLLSFVGLLTALFIVLSTLSMGMIERVQQLGLLRCVGFTRLQLAWMTLIEVLPLGILGIVLGIPLGLLLALGNGWIAPDYGGDFAVSLNGIGLAVAGGLATTAVAAVLPMLAAVRVSPLEAAHPRARRAPRWPIVLAAALAVVFVVVQVTILNEYARRSPWFVRPASAAIALLYLAYAMITPLVIWLVGSLMVYVAAWLLAVRGRLLQDQVGHAVWRSTGIVCGLMVGLSLIVGLVTFSQSFQRVWQFPSQFPAAYIWSFDQMRARQDDVEAIVSRVPGVESFAACNAVNVHVEEKPLFMAQVFASVTWFLGCDPDTFFDLVRVEFIDGERADAIAKLRQGRHVVVAEDFARSRNKSVGDEIKVYFGNEVHLFRIAAVVSSPALDIAAGFFQANTEMRVVASGSVLGTNEDMKRLFDVRGRKLVLFNFDFPPPPPDWQPEHAAGGVGDMPGDLAWETDQTHATLRAIKRELGAPRAYSGTAAELKAAIDREVSEVTRLIAAVPAVALIVAALGVANLMTANVTARAKQLAMLRAVGATRGLILRLVVGEALVLGLLGSLMGVALGVHLAFNTAQLTQQMWGFAIDVTLPWGFLAGAIVFTLALCLVAALVPARRAARTDVVDALHVA
jgi:putative ABC transport system permease protein